MYCRMIFDLLCYFSCVELVEILRTIELGQEILRKISIAPYQRAWTSSRQHLVFSRNKKVWYAYSMYRASAPVLQRVRSHLCFRKSAPNKQKKQLPQQEDQDTQKLAAPF